MLRTKETKTIVLGIVGLLLLIPGVILGIRLGALDITFGDIQHSLFAFSETLEDMMIRDVRIPRVICALLVGGLLGMCGALMQGITRNPIAEPSLLGINQGATLAVSSLYLFGVSLTMVNSVVFAFLGAFASGLLVLLFTMRNPDNGSVAKLLLAGTAISTFFSSLTTIIGLLTNQSQMIAFWVSGGFRSASWSDVILLLVFTVPGVVLAMLMAEKINILRLGDDVAIGLGEDPHRIRRNAIFLIIPLCAAAVVVGKTIGFVGLVIPQIVRMLIGEDYKSMIPMSFLFGAILLTYADIGARMLRDPYEVPIGIFTAMIGVPFFLFMARKERG